MFIHYVHLTGDMSRHLLVSQGYVQVNGGNDDETLEQGSGAWKASCSSLGSLLATWSPDVDDHQDSQREHRPRPHLSLGSAVECARLSYRWWSECVVIIVVICNKMSPIILSITRSASDENRKTLSVWLGEPWREFVLSYAHVLKSTAWKRC